MAGIPLIIPESRMEYNNILHIINKMSYDA